MTASATFDAQVDDRDGRTTVTLWGVFDGGAAARFDEAMAAATTSARDVVLDVSGVVHAEREAAEAIVGAATALGRRGRRLLVVGAPTMLRHLLALGVGDLLRVRGPHPWPVR